MWTFKYFLLIGLPDQEYFGNHCSKPIYVLSYPWNMTSPLFLIRNILWLTLSCYNFQFSTYQHAYYFGTVHIHSNLFYLLVFKAFPIFPILLCNTNLLDLKAVKHYLVYVTYVIHIIFCIRLQPLKLASVLGLFLYLS